MFWNLKDMISWLPKLKFETKILPNAVHCGTIFIPFFYIFNSFCCVITPNNYDFTLNIPYISELEAKSAVSCIHSTECVRPGEIS